MPQEPDPSSPVPNSVPWPDKIERIDDIPEGIWTTPEGERNSAVLDRLEEEARIRQEQGPTPEELELERKYVEIFGQEAIDQARAAFHERITTPWIIHPLRDESTADEPVDPQNP